MKRTVRNAGFVMLGVLIVMMSTSGALALEVAGEELGINLNFTYASKYMWHGYDIFGGNGAFQPSINFDYMGFIAGIWASYPDTSGSEDLSEIDLYIGYGRTFFEEESYAVDATILYTYFTFPKVSHKANLDAQEVDFIISMPNLIPLGPASLVPSYALGYLWDGVQGETPHFDGFYHIFGLSYDIPVPALIPEQEEQAISLKWDIAYNDGPFNTDSDWSYSTIGVSTTFEWNNVYLTPSLNYQFSFNDVVNDEDDFYATISFGYNF
ncbi:MAG: hypothetical protein C4527_07990 [Candidatus Omnitrophota bacterium]|jgi:hypothetical protein|nr:MAG: hypothetical protein C4527_07990 [Candidatus Omnitrophota bacterium]